MKFALIGNDAKGMMLFRLPMLKALREQGHEVTAIYPYTSSKRSDLKRIKAELADMGAKAEPGWLSRTGTNPFADFYYRRTLTKLLKRGGFDAVLAYGIKPIIHGLPAARAAGVPLKTAMVTGLGSAFGTSTGPKHWLVHHLARWGYKSALKEASHVFFQNPSDQQDFEALGVTKSSLDWSLIAGSGVSMDAYPKQPLPSLDDPIRFVFVGRLIAEKGLLEFLQAAQTLAQDGKRAEFWVIGGEDTNPSAVRLTMLENLHHHVKFWGSVDNVAELVAQSHVFVLPSYYREGIPRSSLEAMATGRPVIVADAPGTREAVIDGKTGFKVPPKDSAALTAVMQRYIDEPSLCQTHGDAGFEQVEQRFDVRLVNAQIVKTLESLNSSL